MLTFSDKLKTQIVLETRCRYRLRLRLSKSAENASFLFLTVQGLSGNIFLSHDKFSN